MNYIQFVKRYMTEKPSFRNNHRTLRSAMMSDEVKKEYAKHVKLKRKATKGKKMKAPVEAPKKKDEKCPPVCPPVIVNVSCPGAAPGNGVEVSTSGPAEINNERNTIATTYATEDGESIGTPDGNNSILSAETDYYSADEDGKQTNNTQYSPLQTSRLWRKQQSLHNPDYAQAERVDREVTEDVPKQMEPTQTRTLSSQTEPEITISKKTDDQPSVSSMEVQTDPVQESDVGTNEAKEEEDKQNGAEMALVESLKQNKLNSVLSNAYGTMDGLRKSLWGHEKKAVEHDLEKNNQKNTIALLESTVRNLNDSNNNNQNALNGLNNQIDVLNRKYIQKLTDEKELKIKIQNFEHNVLQVGRLLKQSGITYDLFDKVGVEELKRHLDSLKAQKDLSMREVERLKGQLLAIENGPNNTEQLRKEMKYLTDERNKYQTLLNGSKSELEALRYAFTTAQAKFEKRNREMADEKSLVLRETDEQKKEIERLIELLGKEREKAQNAQRAADVNPVIASYEGLSPLGKVSEHLREYNKDQLMSIVNQVSALDGLSDELIEQLGKAQRADNKTLMHEAIQEVAKSNKDAKVKVDEIGARAKGEERKRKRQRQAEQED